MDITANTSEKTAPAKTDEKWRVKRYNGRVSSYEEAWGRAEALGYSREELLTRDDAIKVAGVKSSGAFNTAMWYAHKGDPVTDEEGNWVYDGGQEIRMYREGFHPEPIVGTLYGSYSLWLRDDIVRFRGASRRRPTQHAADRTAAVRATGRTREASKRPTQHAADRNRAKLAVRPQERE